MSIFSLILVAFAMATDAFAIAICKGVSMKTPRFIDAIKIGILFGVVEAITPVLGWLLGSAVVDYISQWDHWIILALMLFLGIRMIRNSFDDSCCCDDEPAPNKKTFFLLVLTAISTSIDAFAVGISFAFASVNIIVAAILIGCATMIMVTIGVMLGTRLGDLIGKRAELIGGLVLIFIGIYTVISSY
ncbi:manganese efflux pump MntP [Zophobihabitans entericus]|uniref:Putative manganese efflux pump MntP n=1 Tax=Zophobihabitans entericus TaxID=1635327 RepID=A0A6G9I9M9_9GAMM|nr:manganese efflux pump MntP family protein [Zophobihabitans entericus]QIQ20532.1 manganese efflux pump [Zophobihabitans entericus]